MVISRYRTPASLSMTDNDLLMLLQRTSTSPQPGTPAPVTGQVAQPGGVSLDHFRQALMSAGAVPQSSTGASSAQTASSPAPAATGGRITAEMFKQALSSAPVAETMYRLSPNLPSMNVHEVREYLRSDRAMLAQIRDSDSEMADAVMAADIEQLRTVLDKRIREANERNRERNEMMARLAANPLDADAQAKIQEIIRQENVMENMANAMEHNPESFGSVIMLYIDCEVNGVHLKAFVDSGAQMTIMSKECAERCNLLRLMDQRFAGVAKGVGTCKILGRVHIAPLKIGSTHFPTSFSILEGQDIDLLLGLDMLKKHQCLLDLKQNALIIGDEVAPFLSEKDIPQNQRSSAISDEGSSTSTSSTSSSTSSSSSSASADSVPPSASAHNEDLVQMLMTSTGKTRDVVLQALQASDGDGDSAAALLLTL
mmetsp:Transcript_12496/g.31685  ORF Transcript_12496/g.31685 Transcript_12496/m.31685 type:complete len:427 (-) Transcript_12496:743-2023(-)